MLLKQESFSVIFIIENGKSAVTAESMNPIFKNENNSSLVTSNGVVSNEQEELSEDIPPLLIDLTNSGAEINGIGSQSSSSAAARSASQYSPYVWTNPLRDSEIRALLNFMGKQKEINYKLLQQVRNFKEETRIEMDVKSCQIASLQREVDHLKGKLEENGISLNDHKENSQNLPSKRERSVGEMQGEENNVKRIRTHNKSAENQSKLEGSSETTENNDHKRLHEDSRDLQATGSFECLEWNCMLSFDDKLLRNLHLNTAHGYVMETNGSFRCTTEECGKRFRCLESCWEHKKSEHQ
ncbi:unnamed protein product [Orchesella dallaii]|uniref:C2H2-type domain-containing protein n=1 Tax=Orchesella dallaii TaxID=48710 RepID=A0ABP1RMX6_9HEXA